jgi:hypothetical protein
MNDTFTATCAFYIAAVTLNDAGLGLRSSDAPTDAVTLAGSLTAAMDASMSCPALYDRRHSAALGQISPATFEARHTAQTAAA